MGGHSIGKAVCCSLILDNSSPFWKHFACQFGFVIRPYLYNYNVLITERRLPCAQAAEPWSPFVDDPGRFSNVAIGQTAQMALIGYGLEAGSNFAGERSQCTMTSCEVLLILMLPALPKRGNTKV